MAAYDITELDELEFDTSQGYSPKLAWIDATHFIAAYRGADEDGYIATFEVASDGSLTKLHSLEHDTNDCTRVGSLTRIDATHYLLTYDGNGGGAVTDGFAKVFTIDGSFNISQTNVKTIGNHVGGSTTGTAGSSAILDSTHVMIFVKDSNSYYLKIYSINGSYVLTEVGSSSLSYGRPGEIKMFDSSHICFTGYYSGDSKEHFYVYSFNGSYAMSLVKDYAFTDANIHASCSLAVIDATHVIAAANYGSSSPYAGVIYVFAIDGSYNVSAIKTATFQSATGDSEVNTSIIKIDSTHYFLTYARYLSTAWTGWVRTLSLDGSFNISLLDDYQFASNCQPTPDSLLMTESILVTGYTGTDTDGFLNSFEITLVSAPTVTTQAVSDLDTVSGTGNGNITDTGGENCTRRGFCYLEGDSGDPTTADSVVYDDGDFGTGAYTKAITGLSAGTAYRVRAYAVNSAGTGYGTTVDYVTATEKILSESIRMGGLITSQTAKTFVEVLNIIPILKNTLSLVRTLVENFIVNPINSTVLTAERIFEETIKSVEIIFRQTGKSVIEEIKVLDNINSAMILFSTLIETVIISPINATVLTASRIFLEILRATGSAISQTAHIFVETVKVVVNSINQSSFYKVLTDVINVGDQISKNVGRIFTELIKLIQTFSTIRIITFSEIIKISENFILNTSRTFTETINVTWQKITDMSFTLIERVFVRGLISSMAIGKLLKEIIVGSTWFEFTKTQYTELTDHLKVGVSFIRTTTRIFVEIINVIFSNLYNTSRIFIENLNIFDWFQGARSYIFSEALEVVEAFGNFTIGKLLKEIVRVRLIFTEGRNIILSEALAIVDTLSHSTAKIFNEIISITEYLARSIGRTLTQTVKMASRTVFRKTQYKVLSDSIKASVALIKGIGRTLTEIIEVVGELANWSIGKLIIQPIMVADTYLKEWSLSRILSETITITDNVFNQSAKIFTETINVVGNWVLGTISKVLIETVRVVEDIRKSLPAKTYSENIVVNESIFNQAAKIFTEIVNVVGQFVLGTISKLLTEIIKTIDNFSKTWELSRVLSETIAVIGSGFNQGGKIFAEVISVSGEWILGTISKLFVEIVKVGQTINNSMTRVLSEFIMMYENYINTSIKVFSEVISVIGEMANFAIGKLIIQPLTVGVNLVRTMSRTFTQSIETLDSYLTATGRVFSEVISVVDDLNHLIGRIFTETLVAGWDKTKMVLNGIQVGLWKKVARITNGAWKKISRNDN